VRAREEDGPYASLLDLCTRVSLRKVTKRVLESLIKSGACDCFGAPRAALFAALDAAVGKAQKIFKDRQSAQVSLLAMMPAKEEAPESGIGFSCEEANVPEWDEDQKMRFEKEALGFLLTGHPLPQYRQEMIRLELTPLEAARDLRPGAAIRTAVLVTEVREITTSKGKRMAFVKVEDQTAVGEATFFEDVLNASRNLLQSEQPLLLTASIDRRDGGAPLAAAPLAAEDDGEDDEAPKEAIRLRALSVESLADACRDSDAPCRLDVEPPALTPSALEELKVILERHSGKAPTHLAFRLHDVHCVMRLGPRWTVSPTPAFHQDVQRWHEAVCTLNKVEMPCPDPSGD
jgi:DNA polymerase-3 subunit alpha